MAAFMRSMICVVTAERQCLLARAGGVTVDTKRLYARGLRRRPVRVLFPEEGPGQVLKPAGPSSARMGKEIKVTATKKHPEERDSVKAKINMESTINQAQVAVTKDQVDGLRFDRAFPGDKRLGRLVSVARSRTFREHQGKILLEGRRLICDALEAGANPQMVFFSSVDRLRELPLHQLRRATLVKVKFEDIKTWSDVVAPQGVIAIFSRPDPSRLTFTNRGHSLPLSLICDNIRDPGNLGTMLRCAAAAGCSNVLLTKGCVDAWEPKVLRAAMGAHFRLPIYSSLSWEDLEQHLPRPVTVHVADRRREAGDPQGTKLAKAGDYGWVSTRTLNQNKMQHEEYDSDSDSDSEDEGLSLPIVDSQLYHESWAQRPSALVIGGETHGLSVEAEQLAEKTGGRRLFIPVAPDVDSLNSAMAASILLFEGRKQLLQTPAHKRQPRAEQQSS